MQSGVIEYMVELPITFQLGTGMTQLVSREAVSFTTGEPLVAGQQLTGYLRLPGGEGEIGSILRYIARVTRVRQPCGSDDLFEVRAQFKQLDFVPNVAA